MIFLKGFLLFILAVIVLAIIVSSLVVVRERTAVIIERLGKFHRVMAPGFHVKIPVFDQKVATISTAMRQLIISVETKTKDNVFVTVPVSVQLQIPARDENGTLNSVKEAHYAMEDPEKQIGSYIRSNVRSFMAETDLDAAYSSTDDLARSVQQRLENTVSSYGWRIVTVLINEIEPAESVKKAMNDINASLRNKQVAVNEADAKKTRLIKDAEAKAEAKRLSGVGIAEQRKAIVNGMAMQLSDLQKADYTPEQAQAMLMMNTHYDTIGAMAASGKTSVIFTPVSAADHQQMASDLFTQAILDPESPQKLVEGQVKEANTETEN